MLEVEGAAASKELITYTFTHMENFLILLLPAIGTWAFGLEFGPLGWDFGNEVGI